MALYNRPDDLSHSDSPAFARLFESSEPAGHAGIYRCVGCGREVVGEQGRPLPSEHHHPHDDHEGAIRWRGIVYTERGRR